MDYMKLFYFYPDVCVIAMMLSLIRLNFASSGSLLIEVETMRTACWRIAYTYPRHEKKVARRLALKGIEVFVPVVSMVREWANGTRPTIQVPVFPRYIFIHADETTRAIVLADPGVAELAPCFGARNALSADPIEILRGGIDSCHIEPHPYLSAGPAATIWKGPLAGLRGFALPDSGQFVFSIDSIRQSVRIRVPADFVRVDAESAAAPKWGTPWASSA